MMWRVLLLIALIPVLVSADYSKQTNTLLTIDSWQNQSAVVGLIYILLSLPPLLIGWWLIRWVSALSTAGAVGALVLFMLIERAPVMWAWIGAGCVGILAGFLGWHLFIIVFTVQMAVFGWLVGFHILQLTAPGLPIAAFAAGGVCALIGGTIGWRLAPIAAIAQTILFGFIGIFAGMDILCQPINQGERVLLGILVAVITIPAGAWVQWRAHKKAHPAKA